MEESSPLHLVDTRGLVCPEPLILLRNKVRSMREGESVRVLATDPTTERDFSNFCRFMGHILESSHIEAGEYSYIIRKKP